MSNLIRSLMEDSIKVVEDYDDDGFHITQSTYKPTKDEQDHLNSLKSSSEKGKYMQSVFNKNRNK